MARYRRRHKRFLPRSWMSLFVEFGGWAALVLGALLVVFTLFSATALYMADLFDRDGKAAEAVIVDKRIEEKRKSDDNDDVETTHYVTLRFKVKGAPGHTVETDVLKGFYDDVAPGDTRWIRYLVDDPNTVEEDLGMYRRSGRLMNRIGLVVGVAGLAVLYLVGLRANRAVKARRDGEKRYARVTAITGTRRKSRARLEWREEDGATGQSQPHRAAWLSERYQVGDKIVVFRLGAHAFWEGDVGPPRREVQALGGS